MSHAITPTDSGRRAPLTRTAQVHAVLSAGGRIVAGERYGLLQLLDRNGRDVPAWQTAIKNAKARQGRRCRVCGCTDSRACLGGCTWVGEDLCSACEGQS